MKSDSECYLLAYSLNWPRHPLGTTINWPQSLRSTLSIIFSSKFPMFLFWGPDLFCFYNDAYRPSMGNNGKHPGAMGKKGIEVWPEIWETISPEIVQVMNGGASTWHEDLYLPVFRNDKMEDVYRTYSYSPVVGESGTVAGVLVTCNETTEKVFAEKHLSDLTTQLRVYAEAMVKSNYALGQFAYMASHDLKEPLRMITGFMGLLKSKYGKDPDKKANTYIDFAPDGGTRMQKMINDLPELSRQGQKNAKKELSNPGDILNDVKENIINLIDAPGTQINVKTQLPVLHVYRAEIARLIQNLFTNAIKFRKKEVTPVISLSATEQKHEWMFSVEDNSNGITPEKFETIFEIFTRLHPQDNYEGTGLGLAVCKKVVEHHGGRIWVESEVEKGSTFYFTILK